jgi:hypothetical protein
MAKVRPDLFYAFVGTGQVADQTRNHAVAYEAAKKARALKERTAVEELLAIGPPPYSTSGAERAAQVVEPLSNTQTCSSPACSARTERTWLYVADIDDWNAGQDLSGRQLIPQTANPDSVSACRPVRDSALVIPGRGGLHTPTSLGMTRDLAACNYKEFITIPARTLRGIHEV